MEFFILPKISSTTWRNHGIKLRHCVYHGGNVMSSFGGRTTSGFDVIEGSSRRPSPVARCKKEDLL